MLDQLLDLAREAKPDPSKVAQILGFANSVITFILTNVLERRAFVHWRTHTWFIFMILWASFVLCLIDLFLQPPIGSQLPSYQHLTKMSLIIWIIGISWMIFIIKQIVSTTPSTRGHSRPTSLIPFCTKTLSCFGVPFVDDLIRARDSSDKFIFPLVVISQRTASGLRVAQKFFTEGFQDDPDGAGVYLTFTRPWSIIDDQISKLLEDAPETWRSRVVVVDCYSHLYLSKRLGAFSHNGLKVVCCDPRDPTKVQQVLEAELSSLQHQQARGKTCDVRVVYDSLSDFLAVADEELVVAYLRRSIVWEEQYAIKSLYLVWHDLLKEPVSDDYLAWFGNTVLWLKRENERLVATLEGASLRSVTCSYDNVLEMSNMNGFSFNRNRAEALAGALKKVQYSPDDFNEITPFFHDQKRELHFIFFLTAIDHKTHGDIQRYEEQIDGKTIHGSDLLYLKAKNAATKDNDLFMPEKLRSIDYDTLKDVFRTSAGTLPVGLQERGDLLRDAANTLLTKYHGDLSELFEKSKNLLLSPIPKDRGVLERLKAFKAYQDPLGKKSFLLVKLLRRKKLLAVADQENIRVPVDHVLMTIGLRTGMILVEEATSKSLLEKALLDEKSIDSLRRVTALAFQRVAEYSSLPPDHFDDLLWAFGRECFKFPPPFKHEEISKIDIPISKGIGNKEALTNLILMINGLDEQALKQTCDYPVPIAPKTHFF